MEFLRSFLRRNFPGKPVVASPNVGCFLRLASSILQPARTDFFKGMKTPYAWNASKFIHVEFLRHPNVAKFLSVCFPEFQTHEWHPSSCPCGFLQLLWTFSTLLFSFPGNGPLLEAVKSGKAIVITIYQTKLLTEQYIEHQRECFSRFPNMPWRRSRKRCALELLLSSVVCFALFFLFSNRLRP